MHDTGALLSIILGLSWGLFFALYAGRRTRLISEAKKWPGAQGRVLQSAVIKVRSSMIVVQYEFFAPERIVGRTARISGGQFRTEKEQRAFVARFPVGKEVEVYYNPAHPNENCLDRTDASGLRVLWTMASLGFIYGIGMLVSYLLQS